MKKPLFITLAIIVLVSGFFVYNYFFKKKSVDKWDLVPQETVLVYETSDCKTCLEELRNSPVVKLIQKASFEEHQNDTLNSIQKFILAFQQPTLVSLHLTKKDEFDFAYYITNTPNFQQKISLLLGQLYSVKGVKSAKREFNTVEINEVVLKGKTFSWILIEDVWAGSFSPIIIEDIIRTYKSDEAPTFRSVISSVYQLPRIQNDGGNLYIHLNNLSHLFSLFTSKPSGYLVNHFGHSSLLDAKMENKRLVLNGFSFHPLDKKDYFLSTFQDQSPVEFSLKNLISNRTLMLREYGISDGRKFFPKLHQLSKNPFADTLKVLGQALNVEPASFYESFSGELAVSILESKRETLTQILLLKDEKNQAKWFDLFQAVSANFATDSLFREDYAGYSLFEIPIANFPDKLFYPIVDGFSSTYYTQVGNTLCMAESMDELKAFLNDVDQENTWGKSVAQNKFLESTLLESNVNIFINTPKIWNLLSANLQPRWQTFLEQNKNILDELGMGAIQLSHLNDTYYTNVSWSFKEPKAGNVPEVTNRYITNFENGIARFATVKSHVDRSTEVLIQDSAKILNLVSEEGKILWQLPLPDFISGEIRQIDFLNNGKLQYLLATPGSLHVIDRLGNYVKPYPVSIKESNVDHISVIDYDHSKKYRFLVSSTDGKLWMFDKEGNNLDGWQPRIVDEKLISPVNHHRLLGKDYLIAIRKDGLVYLMNRRGELIKNFPLDLNARLEGDYFLETGKKASDTYFTVISVDGVRFKFNLNGRLDSQDALLKNEIDARFALVSEPDFKGYLVVRSEKKQFTVFDANGNEIIKSDFIGNNPVEVKYYSFGNGKDFIVITDLLQQLSFLYDKKGRLVTPIPFDSNALGIFPEDGEKNKVFFSQGKNLTITTAP